jgi:pimeloyl-ACP methyl ester carboxylesterase
VEAIRRTVGADKAALIGWSGMGMELVAYALRHPDRVSRIVQLAPVAPRWEPYGDSLMASRRSRTDGRAFADLQARAGEYRDRPAEYCRELARITNVASFGDTTVASQAPDVCMWRTEWPDRIGPYFGALLASMGSWDWRPRLASLAVPRLVIHGALDNTPLVGNCEWVVGHANARIVVIEGAGHWPQFERPRETVAAISDFLDGRWPASGRQVMSAGDPPCAN